MTEQAGGEAFAPFGVELPAKVQGLIVPNFAALVIGESASNRGRFVVLAKQRPAIVVSDDD